MTRVVPAPITPADLLHRVVRPTLAALARDHRIPHTAAAERVLIAYAGQEGGWRWRRQVLADGTGGPASGRWQFERGGGVRGVMTHTASRAVAQAEVAKRGIVWDDHAVWRALEHDDGLACVFARLLLWTDPQPVPDNEAAAWAAYAERLWRPGAWSRGDAQQRADLRAKFTAAWAEAGRVVAGEPPAVTVAPAPDPRAEALRALDEAAAAIAKARAVLAG